MHSMTDTSDSPTLPSGRFVLRIEPRLHAALRQEAAQAGLSLNEYCARRLTGAGTAVAGPGWSVVERARAVLPTGLAGVVVYGSWARGEAGPDSDVDVLLVVEREVRIVRGLYARWDEQPVGWAGRPVEPHFVRLPGADETPSGLWAEVAVDGVVLFDPGLAVSRVLVALRRRIAAGDLVRREAHGQPYWLEAS